MTSSRHLHISKKPESGKTVPAKQSLGINCIPSNYTASTKLPMVPGLKLNALGIGPHWGFLHWSRFYRLLWHNSALSLWFWLQHMMVWGIHHKKKSLFNNTKYESVRGRTVTIQCPTIAFTGMHHWDNGIQGETRRNEQNNPCHKWTLSLVYTERNSVSVGFVP